jgi:nicotinamide-nucleotide adenylyltransferase
MATRAVLLDSGSAPRALAREAAQLSAQWDEVIVAIDDAPGDLPPLPARWGAVRAQLAGQPRCWATPLVRTPGLPEPRDRCAALESRLGPIDLLMASAELLSVAGPLALNTKQLPSFESEPPEPQAPRSRALLVIRGQPFHLGHLALVERALLLRDELVLVVAAAERALLPDDPFSAGERLALVRAGLSSLLPRVWLVALPAPSWPAMALRQLAYLTPSFDLVVAHNPLLRALAEQQGLALAGLAQPLQIGGTRVSGSLLRQRLMEEGAGPWLDDFVPAASAALLRSWPGLAQRCALIAEAGR